MILFEYTPPLETRTKLGDFQSVEAEELTRLEVVSIDPDSAVESPLFAVWRDLSGEAKTAPPAWAERIASADVIMVMEKDSARNQKLTEPNQAVTVHIVKNRGGDRGKLAFDFSPAFAKFPDAEWL